MEQLSHNKFQEHLAIHRPGKYCLPFEVRPEVVWGGHFGPISKIKNKVAKSATFLGLKKNDI